MNKIAKALRRAGSTITNELKRNTVDERIGYLPDEAHRLALERKAKHGLVICKAARTDQNKTHDLPTLGPRSLTGFKPGDVLAIAWVSDCTLIADKDLFIKQANNLGITLVSVAP